MKLKSLQQQLRCPECRRSQSVRETHRMMNFTFGEIVFLCRCRKKLGEIRFMEWNQLQREAFENPQPAIKENRSRPSLPPGQGQGRGQGRSQGRGQGRPQNQNQNQNQTQGSVQGQNQNQAQAPGQTPQRPRGRGGQDRNRRRR